MTKWFIGFAIAGFVWCMYAQRIAIEVMKPTGDIEFIREFTELLQRRDFGLAESRLDPSINRDTIRKSLIAISTILPKKPITKIRTEGFHFSKTFGDADNSTKTDLALAFFFTDQWYYVEAELNEAGDNRTISSINYSQLLRPIDEINAFSLAGKPPQSYLILAGTGIVSIFVLLSLATCATAHITWWRKVLWCIVIVISVSELTLVWNSGDIQFELLNLGIGAFPFGRDGPDGPYFVNLMAPIGAIVFWIFRRRWRPAGTSPQETQELIERF